MSKISEANRVAKGKVKNLRQSRLNQARSKLGVIPKPTSPKPSATPSRPKRSNTTTSAVPKNKPKNMSEAAWKAIKNRKAKG